MVREALDVRIIDAREEHVPFIAWVQLTPFRSAPPKGNWDLFRGRPGEAPGAVLGRSTVTNGVTVKIACADCREESVIPIDLGPPGTNGTWMEAETAPNELAETERRVLPSKVMLAEMLAPKPDAVTSTMVFGGPETVLMVMEDVTVKNCVGALPTVIE